MFDNLKNSDLIIFLAKRYRKFLETNNETWTKDKIFQIARCFIISAAHIP